MRGSLSLGTEPTGLTPYWYPPGRDVLQPDDIAGAVALWGPAGGTAPTPPQTPSPPPTTGTHYTNTVIGTPGEDRLYGSPGNDVMSGGAGRDLLAGGDGDDLLLGGHEGATLFGQGGADTFVYTGGRNWFMDFDPSQGDQVAGVDLAYVQANGNVYQAGEHYAVYFGETPWGDTADVIWVANTIGPASTSGMEADWFVG